MGMAQTTWDPGGLQQLEQIPYSQTIYDNKIFDALAVAMMVSDASAEEGDGHPRTELDGHAKCLWLVNMRTSSLSWGNTSM